MFILINTLVIGSNVLLVMIVISIEVVMYCVVRF